MLLINQNNLNLNNIVEALRMGQTLVYSTETCYGLGCDATNGNAVKKIFAIKERLESKSLLVLMANVLMVKKYVDWSPVLEKLATKYWPGPITIVATLKSGVVLPRGVVGADGTIALRISAHPLAQQLTKLLDRPLVSTSANISGGDNLYNIAEVEAVFKNKINQPDIIIDAGELPQQKPSTIVKIESEQIHVLRQGEIEIQNPKP